MKNLLSCTALLAILIPAVTGSCQALGFNAPTVVSVEVGLSLFVTAFSLLAFLAAYSPPRVTRVRRQRVKALRLLPAGEAFVAGGVQVGAVKDRVPSA